MNNVQKLVIAQRELIKILVDAYFTPEQLKAIRNLTKRIAKLEKKIVDEETIKLPIIIKTT